MTETTEGADGLIGDEQHAVAVAYLAHALKVCGRREQATTGVLDGLEEDGRDRVRPFLQDDALDVVGADFGQLLALLFLQVGVGMAGLVVQNVSGKHGLEAVGIGCQEPILVGIFPVLLEVLLREPVKEMKGDSFPAVTDDLDVHSHGIPPGIGLRPPL